MSTIAAISTPQAAGGIGVIRVSGEDAIAVSDRIFKAKSGLLLSQLKGYRATLGMVYGNKSAENENAVDEAVCTVFRAPKSYTGEDIVEFSCHGGLFVLQKILRLLLENGAVPAGPGEFTRRAFLNGKMDLTEAEAVMSLISAQGDRAAKAAMTALDGALSEKIKEVNHSITGVCANLSAWVDYPDDEIDYISEKEIKEIFENAKNELEDLLSRFDSGQAITEGVNTAIVGRPNVGKSTLMNLLSGYKRSIVTAVPGTTRDVVEETVRLGDVILRLADTAGIHDTDDEVESIGVSLAKQKIERATLIFAIFDVSRETSEEDLQIIEFCKDKNCIAVLNKNDVESVFDEKAVRDNFRHVVSVSAEKGTGYDELKKTVEFVLGTDKIDASAPMLTTERQRLGVATAVQCLDEAINALGMGMTLDAVNVSADGAVQALLELTGERASEVIVDEVFANFCVGK